MVIYVIHQETLGRIINKTGISLCWQNVMFTRMEISCFNKKEVVLIERSLDRFAWTSLPVLTHALLYCILGQHLSTSSLGLTCGPAGLTKPWRGWETLLKINGQENWTLLIQRRGRQLFLLFLEVVFGDSMILDVTWYMKRHDIWKALCFSMRIHIWFGMFHEGPCGKISIEGVEHCPYSPDLSPCDFLVFSLMKVKLANQQYHSNGKIKNTIWE